MENIFAIFDKEEKFCPYLLEGVLHSEFFNKEPFEPRESDAGDWRTSRNIKTILPEELWFVTKDRRYEFDLRWKGDAFFMSSEFMNLLLKFEINNFQYTKLHMVNKRKENVSTKEYHYVRFYNKLEDAIDMEKSNIERYRQDGTVKKIWDLQLKNTVDFPDAFVLSDIEVLDMIFCSEKFKKEAEDMKIKGITFISSDQAHVYKPPYNRK